MATMKSLYGAAAALLAFGLDREADRYLNPGRSGKTAPGAGLRYSLPKEKFCFVEAEGRKFGRITDSELLTSLREKYKDDAVTRLQIVEGFKRFYDANPEAPKGLDLFYDDPEVEKIREAKATTPRRKPTPKATPKAAD